MDEDQQIRGDGKEDHWESSGDDEVMLTSHSKGVDAPDPLGQTSGTHRNRQMIFGLSGCSRQNLLRGLARYGSMMGDLQWDSSGQRI